MEKSDALKIDLRSSEIAKEKIRYSEIAKDGNWHWHFLLEDTQFR